jgi:AcrR family transcriptional regulator
VRRIPEHRFDELIDGATEVFIERGYRRTQMADVADAIGVAKGTLYGYVESKQALFALCLRWASRSGPVERPAVLPFPTPPTGQLSQRLKQNLAEASVPPRLAAALERERAENPRQELEEVLRDLYRLNEENRRSIKLLDRCHDHPELQGLWQTAGREGSRLAVRHYLELRVAAGQLRALPNLQLAARQVIETIATWAVHIYWDRAPEVFDPDEARDTAIDFLMRALLPLG